MAIPMIAHVTGNLDHLDVAEACSRAISMSPTAVPYVATMNRAGLGMLAVLRRDAAAAEAQYDALESGQGVPLPGAFMSFVRMVPASFMSRSRLLGLLAQTMGRAGPAVSHFEDALAFSRGGGFRPELAWTCHDYAGALLARGDGRPPAPENRVKALALLDEARIICHDLGMARLQDRVDLLQRQTGALPERAPAYPDGLTQREAEVLKLLATGKTDRQIAEELFISVGTASTHVRNILSKTASANRTEATAYAARQGLT
jgi:DNA-binding CsgD family transcriptional regulator